MDRDSRKTWDSEKVGERDTRVPGEKRADWHGFLSGLVRAPCGTAGDSGSGEETTPWSGGLTEVTERGRRKEKAISEQEVGNTMRHVPILRERTARVGQAHPSPWGGRYGDRLSGI